MILKEYALEPGVINSAEKAKYWLSLFGLEKGRQISRFPKKWKKHVFDGFEGGFKDRKYLENRLSKMHSKDFRSNNRSWDNEKDWIDNAMIEDKRKKFDAIIVKDNPNEYKNVLLEHETDETHSDLITSHMEPIKRNLEGVTEWVKPLLEQAEKIAFIDPFFQPNKKEYIEPLRVWFNILKEHQNPNQCYEIHFVVRDERAGDMDTFVKPNFNRKIIPLLPPKSIVSFRRISRGENHNRYLLVENMIGAFYGAGYATASPGSADDDEITRIPMDVNKNKWSQFISNKSNVDFTILT